MNLLHTIHHSAVIKKVLLIFLLIALMLGVGFSLLYRSMHKLLLEKIQRESYAICREKVNYYDQIFAAYEKSGKILSESLSDKPIECWDTILQEIHGNLDSILPEFCAFGAATLPDVEQNRPSNLSLSVLQNGKIQLLHRTNIETDSWFSEVVKTKGGYWCEPFRSKFNNELIAAYTYPIFRTMPNGSKDIIGVAGICINMDILNRDIRKIQLDNQGDILMFSSQWQYLSTKFENLIGTNLKDQPAIDAEIFHQIESTVECNKQESLAQEIHAFHKTMHFFFRRMKTTGWTFVLAFPEDAIFSSVAFFKSLMIALALGLIAVMLISIFLMMQEITIPILKITHFAEEIGKGNFSGPVPVIKGRGEIADMASTLDQMRYSLIQYIFSVQKISSLEAERAKNRKLLLNTLPEHVIDEFNQMGKCTPEFAESATVFFSDIVGYTTHSAELEASVIIEELNSIFSNFDRIFTKHGVERIKTIGDAYMAVAGLHEPKDNHCNRVLAAALEARRFLQERNAKANEHWEIRIGIHTGSIAAGIVGVERYIYDVFGDAVNTAARMEQFSEPMKINVSEDVQKMASNRHFMKRPLIEVKGKGNMQMYFLEDEV